MSSRSRKNQQEGSSTTTSTRRTTISSTPVTISAGDRNRQRSVSPLNITRNEEKEELAELNDRLASYIDYVRKLETDKEYLKRKIKTFSEERLSKHDDARNTYEAEIASLRRLVDDLAKQKAAADVESEKHKDDAKTAQSKLAKRESEARNLQRRVETLERELAVFKNDHDRYEALRPEFDALEKRYAALRRDLDAETLRRNDLENKVSGLREELKFKNRLLEEERTKSIERTITVESEIEDRKAKEYESKLFEQLQAYRDQTSDDLLAYKTEMEHTFESKLKQLRQANSEASKEAEALRAEAAAQRRRAEAAAADAAQRASEADGLRRRVEELERLRRIERDDFDRAQATARDELARLQRELELRFAEFTDLMNTKVALDQEILMYRKMLEGEEHRLNITPVTRETAFSAPGKKRKRPTSSGRGVEVDVDEDDDEGVHSASSGSILSGGSGGNPRVTYRVATNATGNIEFVTDHKELGQCVKIANSSDQETSIGNWVLKQKVDGSEVTFKFPRSLVLQPGATCQIWNHDAGAKHDPPKDLVMKSQSFKMGSHIHFSLLDADKEEQANCEITRELVRYPRASRSHSPTTTEEKCSIM